MKKIRPLALLLLLSALTGPARPQASEPPLPGEDGPAAPTDFVPLLKPGDTLPADQRAPVDKSAPALTPPELFPSESLPDADGQLPNLSPSADGHLPGEALQPGDPIPGSPDDTGLPAAPDSIGGMQLAANAYWHKNPREAKAIAEKQQKPLLMLFRYEKKITSAALGGMITGDPAVAMNDDLLSSEEFKNFASNHLVLTRLFYPVGAVNEKDYPEAKLKALLNFKSWFKVKGMPCLILLDENGREIERITKYSRVKGPDGKEYSSAGPILDRLKTAVGRREAVIAANKAKMESLRAQNYREWTSKAGSTLLAKLVSNTPERITLMDEHGVLFRVQPPQLSILDRAWIQRKHPPEKIVSTGETVPIPNTPPSLLPPPSGQVGGTLGSPAQ